MCLQMHSILKLYNKIVVSTLESAYKGKWLNLVNKVKEKDVMFFLKMTI